ncbi:MAG TPA: hypothetical protein VLB82_11875 [Thermodesulfobacteriota bacterium]|nr:hypothetical protein [Thermodesulfobacteriota bacterium]
MTTTVMSESGLFEFSRIEKAALIVTLVIVSANALLGYQDMAMGAAAGGFLFTANIIAIRFIVNLLIGQKQTKAFSVFAIVLKMLMLIALAVGLFIFTKINIYGFFIGVTGVVIVLIGESSRGNK